MAVCSLIDDAALHSGTGTVTIYVQPREREKAKLESWKCEKDKVEKEINEQSRKLQQLTEERHHSVEELLERRVQKLSDELQLVPEVLAHATHHLVSWHSQPTDPLHQTLNSNITLPLRFLKSYLLTEFTSRLSLVHNYHHFLFLSISFFYREQPKCTFLLRLAFFASLSVFRLTNTFVFPHSSMKCSGIICID